MRILIVIAVSAASAILGHQALTATAVSSGTTPTPAACEQDGLKIEYQTGYVKDLRSYGITNVDVRDINAQCVGSMLQVTLTDAGGAALAVLAEEVDSDAVSFDVTDVAAKELAGVSVLVAGK